MKTGARKFKKKLIATPKKIREDQSVFRQTGLSFVSLVKKGRELLSSTKKIWQELKEV